AAGRQEMRRALLLFLAAAACKSGAQGAPPQDAVPVTVATVQKKTVPLTLRAIGNVEPVASVTIRPQVGGVLQRVGFAEGQEVRKGDVLFEIDARPLQASLAQAEAA